MWSWRRHDHKRYGLVGYGKELKVDVDECMGIGETIVSGMH